MKRWRVTLDGYTGENVEDVDADTMTLERGDLVFRAGCDPIDPLGPRPISRAFAAGHWCSVEAVAPAPTATAAPKKPLPDTSCDRCKHPYDAHTVGPNLACSHAPCRCKGFAPEVDW